MGPLRREKGARALAVVLLIILVVILALVLARTLAARGTGKRAWGGAPSPAHHLVVDALNLTHWARPGDPGRPLTTCDVIETIDATAPLLKKRYPGRIMYVSKDRESELNDERVRAVYDSAARRNGVHVYLVERYDPAAAPRGHAEKKGLHSEQGRDDFLMGLLAWRHRCPVLSRDRFRDFDALKHSVGPFLAIEYTPHRELAVPAKKQQYNPAAAEFSGVRRPRRVGPRETLPGLALPGRG